MQLSSLARVQKRTVLKLDTDCNFRCTGESASSSPRTRSTSTLDRRADLEVAQLALSNVERSPCVRRGEDDGRTLLDCEREAADKHDPGQGEQGRAKA